MKKLPAIVAAAACGILAFAAPAARADALYGNLSVYVWNGVGVTDTANLASQPGGNPTATFTYSGPLDFVNNNSQATGNTFAEFFNSNGANNYTSDISGFSSSTYTLSQFLNGVPMSTPGETGPNAVNTYMEFIGYYTTPTNTSVTVSHDDGASLYYISAAGVSFTSPNPTVDIPSTGWLPAGTDVPFDLVYVESNGAPSDLVVTGLTPTPEPSTIGFMALGMISLAAVAYRSGTLGS
jgi:hypothetical protein